MKNTIVWGTCWFNEPVETLINFYKSSIESLNKLNFCVIPIIFSAKLSCNSSEIKKIKSNISNVIILQNVTNIYPNKNYGIALITKIAQKKKIKYIAIVDSDWDIKENYSFVNNTVLKLIEGNYDIVIPNIGNASGRSNLLIGRTILNLFYPDYKNIILTAFPGSLVSLTSKLYEIVNDVNYHFDWGGEWDIISIAIKNKMNISSADVDVKNIRHRSNNSKMQDSFQIWRALFTNSNIIERFNNLEKCSIELNLNDKLTNEIITKKNVIEFIKIINKKEYTETQKQIMYMVLYPLAFLTGKINSIPIIEDTLEPYDKKELIEILNLAVYCAKNTLKNIDVKTIHRKSQNITGKFISLWNYQNQIEALNNYKEV